jgi:hypothetical protein
MDGTTETVQDEKGLKIWFVRSANPGDLLSEPPRLITIVGSDGKVALISLSDVPLTRPISKELGDLIKLLGPPNQILLHVAQEGTYTLSFVYPSRGFQVDYSDALSVGDTQGNLDDTVCLRKSRSMLVRIDLSPNLGNESRWNWAENLSMDETTLVTMLLQSDRCLPVYP